MASKIIIIKLAQANPATHSASSSSTNVLAHPYGTRQKAKTLIELFGQTSSMLSDSPVTPLTRVRRQDRLNFKAMNVMTTNTTSLEEYVVSLENTVESLTTSLKQKDDQMTFMMKRIIGLIRKRLIDEEIEHENQPDELDRQPTINEAVTVVTQPSYTYAKPYSYMIDRLKMPSSYQPLKFQHFDGKENPC
ncbi:hypothetical protein V6Z11_D09G017700 [Gossypium hirsutum]